MTARNGRVFGYRVTSVQTVPKARLPTAIYSRAGPPASSSSPAAARSSPSPRAAYRDNVS